MTKDSIIVKGAREHNLKNVSLELPRDKLIVFTGLSGSGKSSLAFDTIYAEGQRRYVESFSSYARQFLGQLEKPDVDSIEGLSPAISIDQKTTSKNPRSTVGTVTEIYDYLRLLYARAGIPHCPICKKEITQQTVDQIVDIVLAQPNGTKLQVLAPVIRGKKGEHKKVLEDAKKSGYVRVRVDGTNYDLSEEIKLEKTKKHSIEVVIDRLVMKDGIHQRLADSIETAVSLSNNQVIIDFIGKEERIFSLNYACDEHNISMEELSPRMFSFNSPFGACPSCTGLGTLLKVDPDLVIPNKSLSIREGAVRASGWYYCEKGVIAQMYYEGVARALDFSLDTPVKDLPQKAVDAILYGLGDKKIKLDYKKDGVVREYTHTFEGVINNLHRRHKETTSDFMRREIENAMTESECPECHGERLKEEILNVTVGGRSISELCALSVTAILEFFEKLKLTPRQEAISSLIIKELRERLNFLRSVGLEYLTLSRNAGTLSGGEAQRIRLATQIGSSLIGVIYILDEPSIGLHQRDNDKLIGTLKRLRDLGNTLIVVEHDEETMCAADYIVDVGPGAGVHGGEIVAAGTIDEIKACKESFTGQYLTGAKKIEIPKKRRKGNGCFLEVKGATENNLKNIDVKIPLGAFTCVTGVSGSGKSSLINEVLYKTLAGELNRARTKPGACKEILGLEHLDKVIAIDQSPIGRTPRSNPATYTGVFNDIRDLFASTTEAKIRGYQSGRFSFNVKGGRCEACEGDGILKIEMHFLPDIYVPCEVCKSKRYNRETLEVKYRGKNIYDVLDMTVEEGLEFFSAIPKIQRKIQTLYDVGLGYIKLGQSSTTLSGGEAQRVKLATELSKRATGKTIYILDEPTTGLHMADVHKLIEILQKFCDTGNTVLVIEHNLDVIKTADYILDMGPEGGDRGGNLNAFGTPEQVVKTDTYTGQYLKKLFEK